MGPEAHVDDVHVVVDGPLEGKDEVRDLAFSGRPEDLQGVQVDRRGHPDDQVVVLLRREDAGDVRAMAVVIHGVGVVVDEVVTAFVVIQELGIDVGRNVMDVVDPGVDDRDLDTGARDPGVMDRLGADVRDAPCVVVFEVSGRRRGRERLEAR